MPISILSSVNHFTFKNKIVKQTNSISLSGFTTFRTNGVYTIYAYTTVGTFNNAITITNANNLPLYILSVAGGGSGGSDQAGGGGAGGLLQSAIIINGNDTVNIIVGAGGVCLPGQAVNGNPSSVTFYNNTQFTMSCVGGGGGASYGGLPLTGGSGGGAQTYSPASGASGTVGQGNKGGDSLNGYGYGGGGGAGTAGVTPLQSVGGAGKGGDGVKINTSSLIGFAGSIYANYYWAGGGGAGYGGYTTGTSTSGGNGGNGGGGGGSTNNSVAGQPDTNGINTGTAGGIGEIQLVVQQALIQEVEEVEVVNNQAY